MPQPPDKSKQKDTFESPEQAKETILEINPPAVFFTEVEDPSDTKTDNKIDSKTRPELLQTKSNDRISAPEGMIQIIDRREKDCE
jgi:hypothetical protein